MLGLRLARRVTSVPVRHARLVPPEINLPACSVACDTHVAITAGLGQNDDGLSDDPRGAWTTVHTAGSVGAVEASQTPGARQLLFVAMPFGRKRDPSGRIEIDFDDVYQRAIKPAAVDAGVEVIRADEERGGGIIHKPMYERLLLAEIVIADLTFANANVFYELGIRHAARPHATILIFASIGTLPFDVAPIRSLPYAVKKGGKLGETAAQELREALVQKLERAKESQDLDSPLFELLPKYPGISLPHDATETFRDRARAASSLTERMRAAVRAGNRDELLAIKQEIGSFATASAELPVDLLLAFRDVSAWDDMVRCVEAMPASTREVVAVREQYALALNRRNQPGDRRLAIEELEAVVERYGASPETCGILGRCWKDAWEQASDPDEKALALDRAIEAYGEGFEADPRDFYPGINLATLLLNRGMPEDLERLDALVPVVQFAVARRGGLSSKDYWDRATVLELAVIGNDEPTARRAKASLLADAPPAWMLETTAKNQRMLHAPLAAAGRPVEWVRELADALAA
jgi:hypothetical protein